MLRGALTLALALATLGACGAPSEEAAAPVPEASAQPEKAGPPGRRRSALWGTGGDRWSPAGRLPDFSYAGYRQGEQPIPEVPVAANVRDFGAVGDGVTDDSAAFLEALAAVESGALLVPPGRYRITRVLRIDRSGLVLRGAGRDETVLYFPEHLYAVAGQGPQPNRHAHYGWSWSGGFVWLEGPAPAGDAEAPPLARVIEPADRGDTSVVVSSAAGIEPGGMVRLLQYESDGSLTLHLHAGHQLAGRCLVDRPGFEIVDWAVRVERVEGRRIHFDRPLRVDVRPDWSPEIRRFVPPIEEVGVEHLTVEFPAAEYGGHHREPGYNGILLKNVFNGWVRDVAVVNFDSAVHFWYSRYVTGEDVVLGGRGGHFGLNLGGCQDCLMTRFRIQNRSIHDTSMSNLGNGSVFSRGRGLSLNFDHHRGAAYENLYSDIHVGRAWRGGRRIWQSSGTPSGHYTAARETFWNLRPKVLNRRLPVWPQVNVIGRVRGGGPVTRFLNDGRLEPVAGLRPADLHAAQRARRLGKPVPKRPPLPPPLPPRSEPPRRATP